MASCRVCGTEVGPDSASCAKCGQQVAEPRGAKPTAKTTAGQIVAIILGILAAIWGGLCVWEILFSKGGDWAGLAFLPLFFVCVPIGLLNLAAGLFVRRGSPRGRWFCIVMGIVNLSLLAIPRLLSSHR